VNLAGEPLPMNVVNELLLRRKCQRVINLYGPSEDTTYSTYAIFEEPIAQSPSIGRAIAGTQLYVLSPEARLLPMGAIGELHIAGNGLARGYLNAPDLTAAKFIQNMYDERPGARLYKTGDLVRYRPDGDLEYLGRLDGQVKIRGFRVELGEIQRNLEQLDGVKTAVVLVQEQGALEKRLVAFVERWNSQQEHDAPSSHESWTDGLRRSLLNVLPVYMVPAMIFVLDKMPLTSNGKVDKKALTAMDGDPGLSRREIAAPKTAFEIRIAGLWADMLGVDHGLIGTETSLFDFGGHSLLLVRLANEIRHELGVELPIGTLFQVTNLGDLAEMVEIESTMRLVEEKMSRVAIVSEGSL
jgi:acyl-CoA synthetase (AMP-forming)/AMP-acid ligase II/acyl carrier protein